MVEEQLDIHRQKIEKNKKNLIHTVYKHHTLYKIITHIPS